MRRIRRIIGRTTKIEHDYISEMETGLEEMFPGWPEEADLSKTMGKYTERVDGEMKLQDVDQKQKKDSA